jgi:hypothetical protein
MTETNMPLIELSQKHDEGDFLRVVTSPRRRLTTTPGYRHAGPVRDRTQASSQHDSGLWECDDAGRRGT